MKYTVALLIGAVTAEETVICGNYDEDLWTETDMANDAVTDFDTCKAACEAVVSADTENTNDYCCEGAISNEVWSFCSLYSGPAAEHDARMEEPEAIDGQTM